MDEQRFGHADRHDATQKAQIELVAYRMIRLFIEQYAEPHPDRHGELERCLAANIANQRIDEVVIMTADVPMTAQVKVRYVHCPQRMTYQFAIRQANSLIANPTDITVIANSDIEFDDSLGLLKGIRFADSCFALSRWEGGKLYQHADSQDIWIFQGKIKESLAVAVNFCTGKVGCDNRIAYEALQAGYKVVNPSKDIRCHHRHSSGVRYYDRAVEVIDPPYHLVQPSNLPPSSDRKADTVTAALAKISLAKEVLPDAKPLTGEERASVNEFVLGKGERILHIALNGGTHSAMKRAFQSMGEYKEILWRVEMQTMNARRLNHLITAVAKEFKPTITFMQLQTDGIVEPLTVTHIHGAIFNWTGDIRVPMLDCFRKLAPYITATCFSNVDQAEEVRAMGYGGEYLQIGVDEEIYRPQGAKVTCPEIVFFGNDYGKWFPLSDMRRKMVEALRARYGARFGLYGNYKDAQADLMEDPHGEAAIYRSCKIAINLSQFALRRYTSDRMFRAMGSGAFVLTHRYPQLDLDFTDEYHLATWGSLDELVDRIDYYLAHDTERESIRHCGCSRVHLRHTWSVRAAQILSLRDKYAVADAERAKRLAASPAQRPKYMVLCGGVDQFAKWLRMTGLSEQQAIYVDSELTLETFEPGYTELIKIGTWNSNPLVSSPILREIQKGTWKAGSA